MSENLTSENVTNDKSSSQYQTTGAENPIIFTYNLLGNFSGKAHVSVIAKDIDSGDTFGMGAVFVVKRGDGAGSIVGDIIYPLPAQSDSSMSSASVVISISGSSLIVSATGVLGKTIDWFTSMDLSGIQLS